VPKIARSAGIIPAPSELMTLEEARRFLGIPPRKHRKVK